MTKNALAFVHDTLLDGGINYEFGDYNSDIKYPYWVGEYFDHGDENEDGMSESDFTLSGFSRGKWLSLENDRERIESIFSDCTTILKNGSGVAITYEGCLIVPTGDAELKRMQITLKIKEWKVNV